MSMSKIINYIRRLVLTQFCHKTLILPFVKLVGKLLFYPFSFNCLSKTIILSDSLSKELSKGHKKRMTWHQEEQICFFLFSVTNIKIKLLGITPKTLKLKHYTHFVVVNQLVTYMYSLTTKNLINIKIRYLNLNISILNFGKFQLP